MSNLSVLEQRLLFQLPSEFHQDILREFDRFRMESERMNKEEKKTGQATLTNSEINRLKTTNQHGNDGLTVIEWQAVKAKAIENGIMDWTSKVDSTLSYHENLSLMEQDNNR